MKQKLILIAPIQSRSGYGVHSRIIAKSLLSLPKIVDNFDIEIYPLKWGNTPLNVELPKEISQLIVHNNQINYQPDISIHITIPSEFQKIGKFSIGITAGTEASVANKPFIEGCNRVDLVITPSEFTKLVLQTTKTKDGVIATVPFEVLFEGLDTNIFDKSQVKKSGLTDFLNNDVKEQFCFLFNGHWLQGNIFQDRKDVSGLVHTFLKTFMRKKTKPALILKTSGAGFSITERDSILDRINQIQKMIREQEKFNGQFPNIYVLNGELSDAQVNELYNHPKIKAMVCFSKAEGFGLPMLEFTSTGKPLICSNYSGHLDFVNPDFAILLPGQLTPIDNSAKNEWISEGSWFTVNYTLAGQLMNDVIEKYDKYVERSRKHPKYTRDNFSIEKMNVKFLEILEKYCTLESSQPKTFTLPKLKKL